MQPVRIALPQALPSERLDDWGLAKGAVGPAVATVRGLSSFAMPDGSNGGVWECTPGRWRRQVMQAEFAHFVSGQGWFHPDGGQPFEIRPGDAVFFFPNTKGTWEITETLRKTYVIIAAPPPLRERLLGAMPRPLRAAMRATGSVVATAFSMLRRMGRGAPVRASRAL